ncbi:transglutaminase domain-containing protein (plasmid) [Kitasatospora sp. NBC_01246]|uniref:transglutaminase domain-containing protein n=1 Tax=Kitasatospora sp. NBC_01246 TaxID=2903570 RepID=UPI002E369F13|nr:transglutaminase domain-containing protein [Kitasatospora sp. NBC_01246]
MAGELDRRLRLFETVRAIPYATDGAHDADSLLAAGRGDCLAKSAYLGREFRRLGYPVRRVRWLYRLPAEPAEVLLLASREDVHTATEVRIGDRWVLVDATYDPPLARAGFTVATWDGHHDTLPAHPPAGPLWRPGDGPEPVSLHPGPGGPRYREAFNTWLHSVRGPRSPGG